MIRAKFKVDLSKVRSDIREVVVLVQKKVAFQLLESIVNMTPVDTGRARGNWQVTIGAPATTFHWGRQDKDGGSTISEGLATIESLATLGAVYLTNNLPYILALEGGHSGQAPQGMVQLSLDRIGLQFTR